MSPWGRGGTPSPSLCPSGSVAPRCFPLGGRQGILCMGFSDKQRIAAQEEPGGSIIEKDLGTRCFKTHRHEIPALHNHGMGKLLVKYSLWGLSGKLGDGHQ